ncbi:unnamed protein product, partial [Symbiodinium necroappetens]
MDLDEILGDLPQMGESARHTRESELGEGTSSALVVAAPVDTVPGVVVESCGVVNIVRELMARNQQRLQRHSSGTDSYAGASEISVFCKDVFAWKCSPEHCIYDSVRRQHCATRTSRMQVRLLRLPMASLLEASYGPGKSVLKSLEGRQLLTASAGAVALQISLPHIQVMRTDRATLSGGAALVRGAASVLGRDTALDKSSVGKGDAEVGAFQICVIRMTVVVTWPAHMVKLPLVLPPLLVLSPSSQQLQWAIANHPGLCAVKKLVETILTSAKERLAIQETDSASANERLLFWRLPKYKSAGTLTDWMPCMSRQVNVIETAAVGQ